MLDGLTDERLCDMYVKKNVDGNEFDRRGLLPESGLWAAIVF